MPSYDFDLFTLGAGSGGVAGSRRAGSYGARVGICEDSRVGGTCVIRGCVPKKLLVYGAQFADAFADAAGYRLARGAAGPRLGEPDRAPRTARSTGSKGIYRKLLADAGVQAASRGAGGSSIRTRSRSTASATPPPTS